MPSAQQHSPPRLDLVSRDYTCSPAEIARMERALDRLARGTRNFPVSVLQVTVLHHPRTGEFHVKTSLTLAGRTLFTGERAYELYTAYQKCIDKLVGKVTTYKQQLGQEPEWSKADQASVQERGPAQAPDRAALEKAVADQDYAAFRRGTLMFEEPVRKRIGRWIQRYPDLDALIGDRLELADLVEDVFLTAFEQFPLRPENVPPAEWLEGLIDEVIRAVIARPEEELENVSMAQSALETETDLRLGKGSADRRVG